MAAQDVKNYADENWNQYLESITELSKEQKNGNALVTSDRQMYNFDKITKKIYAKRSNGVPTSADALAFSKKHIQIVKKDACQSSSIVLYFST